jgi:hypothetical protein
MHSPDFFARPVRTSTVLVARLPVLPIRTLPEQAGLSVVVFTRLEILSVGKVSRLQPLHNSFLARSP